MRKERVTDRDLSLGVWQDELTETANVDMLHRRPVQCLSHPLHRTYPIVLTSYHTLAPLSCITRPPGHTRPDHAGSSVCSAAYCANPPNTRNCEIPDWTRGGSGLRPLPRVLRYCIFGVCGYRGNIDAEYHPFSSAQIFVAVS
jgi:hypothetical protein